MGIPIPKDSLLDAVKIDMSHQEMDRLVSELENMWRQFTLHDGTPTGVQWLPCEGVSQALCEECGYEDIPELEDALKGSFVDFLDKLPHVIKRTDENGKVFLQIKPDPPKEQWRPTKMTVKISSVPDLWRVCLKSPHARIEIPELEFEISGDGKRHIDSIYNHIGAAVYNLGNYVRQANTGLSDDHKNKIMDTVIALNIFLDVPTPFTWIVHDPSGTSEFKPMDNVTVEYTSE